MSCLLCQSSVSQYQLEHYYQCSTCDLVFKSAELWLSAEDEKARYATHENSLDNSGYVEFLSPAVRAVCDRIQSPATGLDYGSGPEPVLAQLLKNKSFDMKYYDPYFNSDQEVLTKKYDFIVSTEVAEHFYSPAVEFKKLDSLLKTKACLVLMTSRLHDKINFKEWYYKNDPTHVCFYSDKTMQWIADCYDWKLNLISDKLCSFQKS